MSELALQLISNNKMTRDLYLKLGNCGLIDVPEEVGELVWLKFVSFSDEESPYSTFKNRITRLPSSFSRLKHLRELCLWGCSELDDLSPLVNLTALKILDIRNTKISDLTPLRSCEHLQVLRIRGTHAFDLTPLKYLSSLYELDISETNAFDMTPLADLKNLRYLWISKFQELSLAPVLASCHPSINIYIDGNNQPFQNVIKSSNNTYV